MVKNLIRVNAPWFTFLILSPVFHSLSNYQDVEDAAEEKFLISS